MKVRVTKIEDWDFDIRIAMKELNIKSFRELGEKTGFHWTYLNRIANGMICDVKTARKIINEMTKPKKYIQNYF
jgi:hypothetical protein